MFTLRDIPDLSRFLEDEYMFHRMNFEYYYKLMHNETVEETRQKITKQKKNAEKIVKRNSSIVWRVISIIKEEVHWSKWTVPSKLLELNPMTESEKKSCEEHFEKLVKQKKIILKGNYQLSKMEVKAKTPYTRRNPFGKSSKEYKQVEEKESKQEAKEIETDEGEDEFESS